MGAGIASEVMLSPACDEQIFAISFSGAGGLGDRGEGQTLKTCLNHLLKVHPCRFSSDNRALKGLVK